MGQFIPSGFLNYDQLRKEELEFIRERRKYARAKQTERPVDAAEEGVRDAEVPGEPVKLEHDLVGLALSGGGIRSAVFNLGFLQALSHRGFLRDVDYVCSVSGGGYIAGHVAALANSVAAKENFHDIQVKDHEGPGADATQNEKVSHLGVDEHGQLTNSYRFRHIGSYLFSDIAGITWRYILFTMITVLLVISLLGVMATLAAIAWRSLDLEQVRDVISFLGISDLGAQMGIGDETLYAFLPSVVPFGMLIFSAVCRSVCHAVRYRRGRSWCAGWCRFWLRCWGISLVISLAVLLGNGEMSFALGETTTAVQSKFVWPLVGLVVVSLLPLLKFQSVVNSTRPDAPAWKGFLAIGLAALACGAVPFFMVFWMAREDVSGFAQYRDPTLLPNDITNWSGFSKLCEQFKLKDVELQAVRQARDDQRKSQMFFDGVVRGSGQTAEEHLQTWGSHEFQPFQSLGGATARLKWLWNGAMGHAVNEKDSPAEAVNPIQQYFDMRAKQREQQTAVLMPLNRTHLASPELTVQLVADGCNASEKSATEEAFGGGKVQSPIEFGKEIAKRSREPGNVATFWHQALLDSLVLPKPSESTETLRGFLSKQLESWKPSDVAKFNRLLLEGLYPDVIRPRKMISTNIVPLQDQWCRFQWLMLWSGMSFVLLFVDWNVVSPFYAYYRNKLSSSFVRSAGKLPPDPNFEESELRLADLAPWMRGAPFPLMLASMHFFRKVSMTSSLRRDVDPPESETCQPFCLSPLHCGSALTGWTPTNEYCGGHLNLSDAVALSGAAVTPFMVSNLGITALMATANLRIGQWLPLPGTSRGAGSDYQATGWRIGRELRKGLLSSATPQDYLKKCQMALVADGGFHEFFGLEELLLRRCRLVVVVDAGCNNGRFEFGALADAMRLLRTTHGLEFLDLDHERPVDLYMLKGRATAEQQLHHCCFRVRYPDNFPVQDGPAETLVVYAQMSLTGDEELDLQQFRNVNPNFPDEPTTNQRYSSDQVESYRQLGFHIGNVVCGNTLPHDDNGGGGRAKGWSAQFCEGYVSEWRRLTEGRAPIPGTTARVGRLSSREFHAADDVIREFLTSPAQQAQWMNCLNEWLATGRRPESLLPQPLPSSGQILQLILACEAYIHRGGDLMQASLFPPAGRVRLMDFALQTERSHILEDARYDDAAASKARKELLRDLRQVAVLRVAPKKRLSSSTSRRNRTKTLLSASLHVAVELLVNWGVPLPPQLLESAVCGTLDQYGRNPVPPANRATKPTRKQAAPTLRADGEQPPPATT